jgi:hypothetical protein
MLIFYALSIRPPYYLLLENFLEKIIIVGSYKKTMIQNTNLEKQRYGGINMILRGFLGHHKVLT